MCRSRTVVLVGLLVICAGLPVTAQESPAPAPEQAIAVSDIELLASWMTGARS